MGDEIGCYFTSLTSSTLTHYNNPTKQKPVCLHVPQGRLQCMPAREFSVEVEVQTSFTRYITLKLIAMDAMG